MRNCYSLMILILLLNCVPQYARAQNENNNWTMGGSGYAFTTGQPEYFKIDVQGVSFFGGNASVSTTEGRLLFYTNGLAILDSTHNLMPNGNINGGLVMTGLVFKNLGQQALCIVPDVRDEYRYFVFAFTDTTLADGTLKYHLTYSIVDMRRNNGKGDVDPSYKNILVAEDLARGMTLAKAEDCGFWLLTHSSMLHPQYKNHYMAYKIDEKGLAKEPVVSAGLVPVAMQTFTKPGAGIRVSPDNKRIATLCLSPNDSTLDYMYTQSFIESGDFNPATGAVTDLAIIAEGNSVNMLFWNGTVKKDSQIFNDIGCVEFSGDSRYLYTTQYKRAGKQTDSIRRPDGRDTFLGGWSFLDSTLIYRYDLTLNSTTAIKNSREAIYGNLWRTFYAVENDGFDPITIRRTPDGSKLLLTDFDYTIHDIDTINMTFQVTNSIGCISDINGATPKYNADYIVRGDSVAIWTFLGPIFNYDLGENTLSRRDSLIALALDTLTCNSLEVAIGEGYRNPIWNDGQQLEKRVLESGNTYWVQYENDCHVRIDTFRIRMELPEKPVITTKVFELSTTLHYDSYQWLLNGEVIAGATQKTYQVSANGNYQVVVGNSHGCRDTSDIYKIDNVGMDQAASIKDITVFPNPSHSNIYVNAPVSLKLKLTGIDGKEILSTDSAVISVAALPGGIYLLHICNSEGQLLKTEKIIKAN